MRDGGGSSIRKLSMIDRAALFLDNAKKYIETDNLEDLLNVVKDAQAKKVIITSSSIIKGIIIRKKLAFLKDSLETDIADINCTKTKK